MNIQTKTTLKGIIYILYFFIFSFMMFGTIYTIDKLIETHEIIMLIVTLMLTISAIPLHYNLIKLTMKK